MVLYFEPQILYGMTRPTLCGDVRPHLYQRKADTARQSLPTLLERRVYKMASHGSAGQYEQKQTLDRAFVFILIFINAVFFGIYLHIFIKTRSLSIFI